jgi:hypothetical protein
LKDIQFHREHSVWGESDTNSGSNERQNTDARFFRAHEVTVVIRQGWNWKRQVPTRQL